ncbi:unnamed protein product [Auanema sp. JU1783]|nr:unnamed protein product [Auanema sp. JU1783]
MMSLRVLSILLIGLSLTSAYVVVDKAIKNETDVDVNTILQAFGAPACMRKCVDPFIYSLDVLWEMKNVMQRSQRVCNAYYEARDCLKNHQYCDIYDIFNHATLSFGHRCEKQTVLISKMEDCLTENVDQVLQKCDESCRCRANITAFSQRPEIKLAAQLGGNIFMASDHIGDMCSSLGCAIPCVTENLNEVCAYSGYLALDAILQPFEAVSQALAKMPEGIRDIVKTKLDKKCHFTISPVSLRKIRKGDFNVLN